MCCVFIGPGHSLPYPHPHPTLWDTESQSFRVGGGGVYTSACISLCSGCEGRGQPSQGKTHNEAMRGTRGTMSKVMTMCRCPWLGNYSPIIDSPSRPPPLAWGLHESHLYAKLSFTSSSKILWTGQDCFDIFCLVFTGRVGVKEQEIKDTTLLHFKRLPSLQPLLYPPRSTRWQCSTSQDKLVKGSARIIKAAI